MFLKNLYLKDFRNYAEAEPQFVSGVNLLVGGNANGKTNLLEAIAYLSTARAFRAKREQELIRFGAEYAELTAQVWSGQREQELRVLLFSDRRPRRLFLNGVKQKTSAGICGVLTSVLFRPEDLYLLKKGAQSRRRFLDDVIGQLRPNYEAAITEYSRLLEQKSALLSAWREAPSYLDILPEYDQRMAQVGAIVISYRARCLKTLGALAAGFHDEFSEGKERLCLQYRTVSTVDDPFAPLDTLRAQLAEHQRTHRQAELESGQCLSGPHKDDFETTVNELPAALYASQGQLRTATISLKLAQRKLLRRESGEEPVLLLDDVLSELDAGRQNFVLNCLSGGQVFITCCETDRLTDLGQVFHIRDGAVE